MAAGKRGEWFSSHRDHFVRNALSETLGLVVWFQQLYDRYRLAYLGEAPTDDGTFARGRAAMEAELLNQFTIMVGTETSRGPLWRLKDLCHQIWPSVDAGQSIHGVLFDWLIGSLFHECMKLKENLYLLSNYGARTSTVDTLVAQIGQRPKTNGNGPLEDIRMLLGQITGDIPRQFERIGFLFNQASYLLRLMLPALLENPLVVRLLVEQEAVVTDLWGESLEDLFGSLCAGGAAAGFCLAGESFFRGQWFDEALHWYERALACDRWCQEAVVRTTQLKAILQHDRATTGGRTCPSSVIFSEGGAHHGNTSRH